jgi:hypothetical protein
MRLDKRKPSGREKDEAAIQLLSKLREQMYCTNVSIVRQSAFNLSWMQEDGLDILKEALLGNGPRRAKSAAAYGLRKMHGRMRKLAEEVLVQGISHPDPKTAEIAGNALVILKRGKGAGKRFGRPRPRGKFEIREIRGEKGRPQAPRREPQQRGRRPNDHMTGRRRD